MKMEAIRNGDDTPSLSNDQPKNSSAVTHGNVNAVPSGINATDIPSIHNVCDCDIPTTPSASSESPSRESFVSPSQSTMRPSSSTRVKTEIEPTYMKK